MPKENNNVFLQTKNLSKTYEHECGTWSLEQMRSFQDSLAGKEIPRTSCLFGINTTLNRTGHTARVYKMPSGFNLEPITEKLTIHVNPDIVNCPCHVNGPQECLKCIASGKCPDKFVQDTFACELFPHLYVQEQIITKIDNYIQPLDGLRNFCSDSKEAVYQYEYYLTDKSPNEHVIALTQYTGHHSYKIGDHVMVQKLIPISFGLYDKNRILTDVVKKRFGIDR